MDDLIADFLVEAHEGLEVIDVELVRFEARPEDRAALDKIFRLVHTLKGACGFLGLGRLEAIAHAGETLLGRFRDGRLEVSSQAVTAVLSAIDRIKMILDGLGDLGREPEGDDTALIQALEAFSDGAAPSEQSPVAAEPEPLAADVAAPERTLRPGEVSLEELEAAFLAAEGPVFDAPAPPVETPSAASPAATFEPDQTDSAPEALVSESLGPQTIRVGVDVLEDMMTLVSELVLTRNQLLQLNRGRGDETFTPPLQRLSSITGELQDSVMKTRMQPIGQAWKKLPRLVRDLSGELGKPIELVMEGEATELDRQVLEQIRDPLTHMVRNSADHGLEGPEARRAAGKPEAGLIHLSAYHEGGAIVIRLRDDGRGLDTARIREKAIEKGIVGRAEAETMTEAQVHRLIFAPGFSTAAVVTNVSGRGVGMDVVRSNIEQIGGQIELQSTLGQGCVVTVKIPLTLAIVSALIIRAAGERFAVPQASVQELVKVSADSDHRFEEIEHVRMLRLREQLIPLIDLSEELGRERRHEAKFVLIMRVGAHRFGVLVEEVIDTEEIVVKPLASVLRTIPVFSGATLLGDGSVVLIIDPNGLSDRAGDMPARAQKAIDEAAVWTEAEAAELVSLLIVRVGAGALKAVELSRITRLEQVPVATIQSIGDRAAVDYRGKLMPVLTIEEGQRFVESGSQPLLVVQGMLYAMGLAVDQIVDVVGAKLDIELTASRPGVRGVALVNGRATELLDLDHFMLLALAEHAKGATGGDADGRIAA
ncbi:chemotaxis protein CheA [Caulobacter vibrioides]|uniref:Chemotaxis protein CheA n=2 Tax=Caulobacter vibrioides TaxID=155892 RepID=Q9AAK3_CAUVC|nr:chemotaxis protein CheA [Caulobacter vibrioides]YP_002516003.1 chemotaxis histidine kinase protein cheAII [Caulobacter vibrioides NA1000]AAK22580.1 chemotaxis protein CheA [Caulobacter vibrioides CB15]ACL94095.1 chemotaxis histidine kinase protein cheAII [Caulobacter vibrioides NA1000]ATC27438.1 chemotaxis protein CheA [Caulobacter vibrioides]QXZ52676.1 chemotaxis protein CheA [Caulobacter vibrioides]